jgi:hypothetical protein
MTQRDDTVYTLKKVSQFSVYTAKWGGLSSATDFFGQFILNTANGQIDHVFMDKKIAKYSTGPGLHSGPLKDYYGTVNCSLNGAISVNQNFKSRDQIKSHLKSSYEKQKMPSFADIKALPEDRNDPKKEEEAKR